jgi:hypothetical protein
MRTPVWSREEAIAGVKQQIWRYLTEAVQHETELHLEAAAILRMPPSEIRTLAQAHFILGEEVKQLLAAMPALMRRLATTTVDQEERSAERIRGPIRWGPTIAAQAATGVRQTYVTAPARRAYETPENRVLIASLSAIVEVARRTGWHRLSDRGLVGEVRKRHEAARGWLAHRAFSGLLPTMPTERTIRRVSTGRARRRYQPAVDVIRTYQRLVRRLDRQAIRAAVEDHALVTGDDDTLFELICGFGIEKALKRLGWEVSFPGLIRNGNRFITASRDDTTLDCFYQFAPPELRAHSRYEQVQVEHAFRHVGRLRPDFVLRTNSPAGQGWVLVEVKGGPKRQVAESARAALLDLLAYRRDYENALADERVPYGLGIAWGRELDPVITKDAVLCTPDRLDDALDLLIDKAQSPSDQ